MATTLPLGIRVAAGLVGTSFDHLVKLPGELPGLTVSFAGQLLRTSMRLRQEIAELAARGDELLAPLVGGAEEHPAWATFDEDEDESSSSGAAAPSTAAAGQEASADAQAPADSDAPSTPPNTEAEDPTRTLVESLVVDRTVGQSPVSDDDGDGEGLNADHTVDLVDLAEDDRAEDANPEPADDSADRVDELVYSTSTTDGDSAIPADPAIPADHPLSVSELKDRLDDLDAPAVRELLAREEAGPNRAPYITLLTNRLTTLDHQNR
jgi:hypothetical protein